MSARRALLAGVLTALALTQVAAAAYEPNDPLAAKQWHLAANRAFEFWASPPVLPAVRVGVIDSGSTRAIRISRTPSWRRGASSAARRARTHPATGRSSPA